MPKEVREGIMAFAILVLTVTVLVMGAAVLKIENRVSELQQQENTNAQMLLCFENHGAWMSDGCH